MFKLKKSRIILTVFLLMAGLACYGEKNSSYGKKLIEAMNASDWFSLDSLYQIVPKEFIDSVQDIYSRCLIGNRFNRSDISIPAFEELFSKSSKNHNFGILFTLVNMYAYELSRLGRNDEAAKVLTAFLESSKDIPDGRKINLEQQIAKYSGLASFNPYTITFEKGRGSIPFQVDTVGKKEKGATLMYLNETSINGVQSRVVFDTGAPVNLISSSLAKELGLNVIGGEQPLQGIGKQQAAFAVAKEMKLGNIVVKDVPFCVMDIATGSEAGDEVMASMEIVVGSELMLHLKDLTLDFVNNEITVPEEESERSGKAPNLCFSSMMNLEAKGILQDSTMLMLIDTGNTAYCYVGEKFYKAHRKLVKSKGKKDKVRSAGVGGVYESDCYEVPDIMLKLGGSSVTLPMIKVFEKGTPHNDECNIGLKALMLFKKVRFNMVDFILTTE